MEIAARTEMRMSSIEVEGPSSSSVNFSDELDRGMDVPLSVGMAFSADGRGGNRKTGMDVIVKSLKIEVGLWEGEENSLGVEPERVVGDSSVGNKS